jgi:hypothetical protein
MSSTLKTAVLGVALVVACSSTSAVRDGDTEAVQSALQAPRVPCPPDEFPQGWRPCDELEGAVAQSPRDLSDDTWSADGDRADALLPDVGEIHMPQAVGPRGVKCNDHTHEGVEHMGADPCSGGESVGGHGHDRCDTVAEGQVLEHHEVFTTCALPPTLKGDLSDCVFGQTEAAPCVVTVVASFIQIDSSSKNDRVSGGPITRTYNGSTTGQRCGCSNQPVGWSIDTETCWRVSAETFETKVCEHRHEHLHVVRPLVTAPDLLWSPAKD